jgi:hypothetical protein
VFGALRLDAATFEEVEHDRSATGQAALVVAVAALAGGIASVRAAEPMAIVLALLLVLFSWAVGSWILLQIGTKVLPGRSTQSDLGELLRSVGFAQAPGMFGVAALVPGIGGIVGVIVSIWTIAALVVAVRQALDYVETWKAVLVCLVVWAVMFGTLLAGFLLTARSVA